MGDSSAAGKKKCVHEKGSCLTSHFDDKVETIQNHQINLLRKTRAAFVAIVTEKKRKLTLLILHDANNKAVAVPAQIVAGVTKRNKGYLRVRLLYFNFVIQCLCCVSLHHCCQ